jgi:hypothetical protein
MAEKIYLDADGNEARREKAGRGRPPKGSHRDADGNLVIPFVSEEDAEAAVVVSPEYVVLDHEGNEVTREAKGRGRPKRGFEKQTEGEHKGHWVSVLEAPEVTATEAPEVVEADVAAPAEA